MNTSQPPVDEPASETVRDIIVVGASAGGVEALEELVGSFPAEFGASVFVVLHVMPGGTSVLAQILQRRTQMHCSAARSGERVERGRIYVAPPDHHMLVADGHVVLTHGPRENGHRPAVDPLFRSAARNFGPRVIGVVLSGSLDDGTAGLKMIADYGGRALVQDPKEALYPSMPRSALAYVPSAETLPVAGMAARICDIIESPLPVSASVEPMHSDEELSAELDPQGTPEGKLTDLTCPECGGTLWETSENEVRRFRCHVGHSYSVASLEVSQSDSLEAALWAAVRSLQERARLFRRLGRRADGSSMARYTVKAEEARRHAEALRVLIEQVGRETVEADEGIPTGAGEADAAEL